MILFHRTTPEEAERILAGGQWRSREFPARVYFSTSPNGQAEGYGVAILSVDVDVDLCELDDEFPDGEQHYAVPVGHLNGLLVRPKAVTPGA